MNILCTQNKSLYIAFQSRNRLTMNSKQLLKRRLSISPLSPASGSEYLPPSDSEVHQLSPVHRIKRNRVERPQSARNEGGRSPAIMQSIEGGGGLPAPTSESGGSWHKRLRPRPLKEAPNIAFEDQSEVSTGYRLDGPSIAPLSFLQHTQPKTVFCHRPPHYPLGNNRLEKEIWHHFRIFARDFPRYNYSTFKAQYREEQGASDPDYLFKERGDRSPTPGYTSSEPSIHSPSDIDTVELYGYAARSPVTSRSPSPSESGLNDQNA